ncbi:aminopeptidase P family protein [Brevundimonas terrae]|uniref:Aminopeptidase P family protein n=1 Tax=Brevundimonas terrae TaxID=363631 RepID=A0ABP3ICV3_9CAUL|nr:aminopeptidase P family protein [Brevundimonas terrae]NIJ27189.1 Xaa-Pro aminopeptidase [Brevundimonas terrae]
MRQTFDETTDPSFGAKHLPLVRAEMAKQGLDGLLVPHEDEHQNEYLPDASERLAFVTGFTGSAGAGVVFADSAAIFVDGRYTVQAKAQTDEALFARVPLNEQNAWLSANVKSGQVIGYDPRLHSPDALDALRAAVQKAGASLKAVVQSPIDLAWGDARPAQPQAPVVPHPEKYAGESAASKRARIGQSIADKGGDVAVLTAPSSLAWLFNIRGGDVIRTPLPLGQAIVRADGSATIFLDPAKITDELPAWLGNEVTLAAPETLEGALAALSGQKVVIDPAISSAWYFDALESAGATVVRAMDPCAIPRACKNAVEIEGSRRAHIRDGAALTRFLYWVDTYAQENLPDERAIVEALEGFREATGELKDLSFDTIAGVAANGALPHYKPVGAKIRPMEKGSLLLVDGGGQYLDGTTDVTRTMAIGEGTDEQRRMFTLVLKGHIAMAVIRFPAGASGMQIDAVARQPLWNAGFDFDHGTGHGVGSYLGVHEGPQRIANWGTSQPLMTGMILSNEPGYYREGEWGIRIETLQVVTEPSVPEGGERKMHGFEQLTLAPLDRKLIDVDMLTPQERAYVDAYHAEVLAKVGPLLADGVQKDEAALAWLKTQTVAL